MIALFYATAALAAEPLDLTIYKKVDLSYVISLSGCEGTYEGSGKVISAEANRITFRGTWTTDSQTCLAKKGESVGTSVLWVPDDKKAFHTVRLTADNTAIEEWIVHGEEADQERFTSNMQAQKQYWINELASVPVDHSLTFTLTEPLAFGRGETQHTLSVRFTPK
jgi:hypothetical protein